MVQYIKQLLYKHEDGSSDAYHHMRAAHPLSHPLGYGDKILGAFQFISIVPGTVREPASVKECEK